MGQKIQMQGRAHSVTAAGSGSNNNNGGSPPLTPMIRLALASFVLCSVWNLYFCAYFHRFQQEQQAAQGSNGNGIAGSNPMLLRSLHQFKASNAILAESLQRYERKVEEFMGPMAREVADEVASVVGGYVGGGSGADAAGDENYSDADTSKTDAANDHGTNNAADNAKTKHDDDETSMKANGNDNRDDRDELHVVDKRDRRHEAGEAAVVALENAVTAADTADDAAGNAQNEQKGRFSIDLEAAETYLSTKGPELLRQTLTAYVEPPSTLLKDRDTAVPYDQGEAKDKMDIGKPPKFVVPLPLRTHTPDDLHQYQYSKLQTCADLPAKLPVDAGLLLNDKGEHIIVNVNNKDPIQDPLKDAEYCPVNADPFLPWLHDVFPSPNGKTIHFIAQNKRRCNTGNRFLADLERLEPQVALMQPISVARIEEERAKELAPELWTPDHGEVAEDGGSSPPRYRLAPFDEASSDGQYTRFICRFHATSVDGNGNNGDPTSTIIGETLSTYPMNYELANYRKAMPSYGSMLTPKGKDNAQFWLSNFRFDCPVPDVPGLAETIAAGGGILSDGTPLIHVDIVPIRTSPRFGVQEVYFQEDLAGKRSDYGRSVGDKWKWDDVMGTKPGQYGFDPKIRWGERNVVPRIEASGRYANIPICRPPPPTLEEEAGDGVDGAQEEEKEEVEVQGDGTYDAVTDSNRKKKHGLIGCLWASKQYTTRGHESAISDTTERPIEWLEYNLMVGFDHIYVYDNTGAHTDESDLRETLSRFSPSEVTRIEWPYRVCNNNVPAHENTGERSSQHAAEASCRQRYGAHSEWVAAIDPDEYLVPMGKYDNLKDVLRDVGSKGTEILGFKSTRAFPQADLMEPYFDDGDCGTKESPNCLQKSKDTLNLELYNCDVSELPKPEWAQRAKKQIYRPSYVLSHYVHYSTISKGLVESCASMASRGGKCQHSWKERIPTERFSDERNEAVMIHSKTLVPRDSVDWRTRCKPDFVESHKKKCRVGFPVPNYEASAFGKEDGNGMKYNCYSYQRVNEVWVPKLREAMKKREEEYKAKKLRL